MIITVTTASGNIPSKDKPGQGEGDSMKNTFGVFLEGKNYASFVFNSWKDADIFSRCFNTVCMDDTCHVEAI